MTHSLLSATAFWCAAVPAVLFCWNLFYFRRPPLISRVSDLAPVRISVLIPARDEEQNIGAARCRAQLDLAQVTHSLLSATAFWCAAVPAVLFCWNLFYFRRPPLISRVSDLAPVRISVLIPARDEEQNIGAAVQSVLASHNVDLELIVLDDASTDRTQAIVNGFAAIDPRVRCVAAPPLAAGWAGKAHAAHALAGLASHNIFCFIDADVRIEPQTLARMHALLAKTGSTMVSGFPLEITVTPLEWLLIPLIHFLLLCYLPFAGMRNTNMPAFGAGCGQFIMVTRQAYQNTGGYASVRATMHDGITLAKLFRKCGYHTEVADLTGLATCRMYNNGGDVWQGLMKNATEGIAAPARILPFTLLLFCGQVLPWLLLACTAISLNPLHLQLIVAACAFSLLPRLVSVARFHQRIPGAVLHPLGVACLLVLQWLALFRKLRGTKAQWKGRAFKAG